MQKLTSVLQTIIEQEENARTNLLISDGRKFVDKIGRALGSLKNSFLLSAAEAMNLLSLVRLAVDLNLYPDLTRFHIDRLFMEIQPAHFEWVRNTSSAIEEAHRADYLRRYFSKFGDLTFDRIEGIDFHFL
jgi:protein arginine kinase